MTVQDPTLSTPPTQEELASDLASIVDVDEDLATEIVHVLEGGDTNSALPQAPEGFRRQLGHRLKQARLQRD